MESIVASHRSATHGEHGNSASAGPSQTPRTKKALHATTTTRRALGDISNRKLQQQHQQHPPAPFGKSSVSVNPTTLAKLGRPPESSASAIASKQQQPVGVVSNRNRRVGLVVHNDPPSGVVAATLDAPLGGHHTLEWDVERPAGRTYHQQIQNGDLDDDDNRLNVSLEGAMTFRQEWSTWHQQRLEEAWSNDEPDVAPTSFQAVDQEDLDSLVALDAAEPSNDGAWSSDKDDTIQNCNAPDWSLDESIQDDVQLQSQWSEISW